MPLAYVTTNRGNHYETAILFTFCYRVFVACQKDTGDDNKENAEQTILNVSYGADTAQRMDVYLPANRTTTDTKVLVLVHGGAWSTGDKTEFNEFIRSSNNACRAMLSLTSTTG
jgi:acetyl esterase/lipase